MLQEIGWLDWLPDRILLVNNEELQQLDKCLVGFLELGFGKWTP